MDEKLLKFWGNFLLQMAEGQKQTNQFVKMMQNFFESPEDRQKGFPAMENIFASFQKMYGSDKTEPLTNAGVEYAKMTESAYAEFRKAFQEYVGMIGMIPKNEHLELVEKYEHLKQKCAEQEETIRHLRMLLGTKGVSPKVLSDQLEKMARSQGEIFVRMMNDFNQYFKTTNADGKPSEPPANNDDTPLTSGLSDDLEAEMGADSRTDTTVNTPIKTPIIVQTDDTF